MTDRVPISPEVLRWARETRMLAIADVVRKLGRASVTVESISAWESGSASPTFAQLEALAYTIYKRPLAVFFFPVIPEEETLKTEFRTLPDAAIGPFPACYG